jgi:hypothetical protein
MPERQDLLFVEGSSDCDLELEEGVQHGQTALGAGIQAACAGGLPKPTSQLCCDINSLIRPGTKHRWAQAAAGGSLRFWAGRLRASIRWDKTVKPRPKLGGFLLRTVLR